MTIIPNDPTDSNAALKIAIRFGLLGLAVLTVAGIAGWGLADGSRGSWGAIIGSAVGGGFILITVVLVLVTSSMSPTASMSVILGGWFVKTVVAIVVLAVLKNYDFYNKWALAIQVIAAIVIVLGAELFGLLRTRVPYVDDAPGG